jgi:hypothetical protein
MIKNPSRKLPKVFVLIIPQVIRIHISKWEVVLVCRPRRLGGMRIFVLIIPQMIRIVHFSEWEEVVLVSRRFGGVKMLKDINIMANYGHRHEYNDNLNSPCSYDMTGKREFRLMQGHASALTGPRDYISEAGLGLQDSDVPVY